MSISIRNLIAAMAATLLLAAPCRGDEPEETGKAGPPEKAAGAAGAEGEKPDAGATAGGAAKTAPKTEPTLQQLLKYNEASIFGGVVAIIGEDRFEVLFSKPGEMLRGFEGKAIFDETSPGARGANSRFYKHEVDKKQVPIANLAAVGIAPPGSAWTVWTSRFPIAGEARVKFDFRIPNLLTIDSGFLVRLNVGKDRYLESQFFTGLTKYANGKVLGKAVTPIKEYYGPASKWFPRKEEKGVNVEIATEGDKCIVKVKNQELVALSKVSDVGAGKVAFGFKKVAFTIQNLSISGKLDLEWCKAQIEALEKSGKLVKKAPEPPPDPYAIPPDPAAAAEAAKKAEEEKKAKEGNKEL